MAGLAGGFAKLLPLLFLGYVAYEVHNLYLFCQPPLALEGAKSGNVAWDLSSAGPLDLCVVLSLTEKQPPSSALEGGGAAAGAVAAAKDQHVLLGVFEAVDPADADNTRPDLKLEALELRGGFLRNRTMFLHVLAVPHGKRGATPLRATVHKISRQVVQPNRRIKKWYLLGGPPSSANVTQEEEEARVEEAIGDAPVASLPKVVDLGFVWEDRELDIQGLREKGYGHMVRGGALQLPMYVNTLVSPRDEFSPVVAGIRPPSMELRFRSVGMGYWTMQHQIGIAFDEAEKLYGMNEYDVDSFKQMVGGSSPWKLVLVYSIAILHLLFEMLAFSSDITFWREKTSFEGLSSNSVTLQACSNIIMFLYIREQKQTKFVLYFLAFRFCLQLWKLRKLTTFQRQPGFPFVRWVSRAGIESKLEEMQGIDAYERSCMGKLCFVLLPAMAAFCAYRLVHEKFRSWYSWLVLSLAVCAQAGGFVVMTPQVFLNHRLQSVEHLPWKALTYQAINTFIDDVFTLCIRMPEIQKYSVFRDDIIFIACCVQRYMYRKPPADTAKPLAVASNDGEEERPKEE